MHWNPWHGCRRYSEGCLHCYVYRIDARVGRDAAHIFKTADYDLPVRLDKRGGYALRGDGVVYTCFSSDFLLENADAWRPRAWEMMRLRFDLEFFFVTKRIARLVACLPPDWGSGYANVHIACTMENQKRADERLPILADVPVAHKHIVCEPLLEAIDFGAHLANIRPESVVVGGESGPQARLCDFKWVRGVRAQCARANVPFHFKQTGAQFRAHGRIYRIPRALQAEQAAKSGIDFP